MAVDTHVGTGAELDRRYANVRAAMTEHSLDALVVAGSEYSGFEGAVTYLTGFQIVHRYAYAVVPADGDPFVVFPSEARYVGEHATALVELSKGRFHAVGQRSALRLREAVNVNAAETVNHANVTGLRHKGLAVDEAPQRKQRVDAACIAEVTEDAPDPHHGTTSTSNRSCFPGS